MYVDSNGDFWSVSIFKDVLTFGPFTNTQVFAFTSPDCSGPAYFTTDPAFAQPPPPYAHVVFRDRPDTSGNLRVRNPDAKLINIQVGSILDTANPPCSTGLSGSLTVLAVADTTIVTPPDIAVSMPMHPVFTP